MSTPVAIPYDRKVAVDVSATPDYLGASASVGVLRTGSTINKADGGDYVTLSVNESTTYAWSGVHTHTNDVIFDGATAGRDITFDRSENRLRLEDNAQLSFGAGGATPYDVALFSDGSQLVARFPPSGGVTADMLFKAVGDPYTGDPVPQLDGGNDNNWSSFGILVLRYQVFAWDQTGTFDAYLLAQDHSEDGYIYLTFDSAANTGKIEVGGADNSTNVIAMGVDNIATKFGLVAGTPHHTFDIGTGDARIRGTGGWLVGGSLSSSDHKGRFRDDGTQVVVESVSSLRPMRVAGGANTASNGNGSALDLRSGASAGNGGSALVGYAVPTTQGTGTTVRNPVEHFRAGEGFFTITHPAEADNISGVTNYLSLRLTRTTSGDDPGADFNLVRGTTTNGTLTTVATIPIPASTRVRLKVYSALAQRTGGSAGTAGDGATYEASATYYNAAGTVSAKQSTVNVIEEDQAGWDFQLNISGTNVLIQVQGATNNNVTWHVFFTLQYLSQ